MTALVRCLRCKHFTPDPELETWGSCALRALPSLEHLGLRDPVWDGLFERECDGFEVKE